MKATNPTSAGVDDSEYAGPRSPLRVMQIVETLAEMPAGLSLTQLSERLAIPKTSLLSQLRVLLQGGYITMQETRYLLGNASLRLGLVIAASATVANAARPLVARLAQDTGETAMLAMLDPAAALAVYVEKTNGANPIRFSPDIGARRPLYCTGFGRALLAFQDQAFVQHYFDAQALPRVTEHTVTVPQDLHQCLDQVRAQGVATTLEEHTLQAAAIAAPVFEQQGPVRYAIGIALPAVRVSPARARLQAQVVEAAKELAWALGAAWRVAD